MSLIVSSSDFIEREIYNEQTNQNLGPIGQIGNLLAEDLVGENVIQLHNREISSGEQAQRIGDELLDYRIENLDFIVALQVFFVGLSRPYLFENKKD